MVKTAKQLAKTITKLRNDRNWTQYELARRIKCTHVTIGTLEKGSCFPSFKILIRFAQVFKISLDEFVGLKKIK